MKKPFYKVVLHFGKSRTFQYSLSADSVAKARTLTREKAVLAGYFDHVYMIEVIKDNGSVNVQTF